MTIAHYGAQTFEMWRVACLWKRKMIKVKKAELSLCLTNYSLRHEDARGSGCKYIHFFFTSALVRGEWSASRYIRLPPGIEFPVPIRWEAGWAPESVWTVLRILTLPGLELWSLSLPARSQLLYRLRYRDSSKKMVVIELQWKKLNVWSQTLISCSIFFGPGAGNGV
jgi:hypothetical protein